MTDDNLESDRADRDRDRRREAHWQIAEAGADDQLRTADENDAHERSQHEWENEGGASGRPNDT